MNNKRQADEYITKENGVTPNQESSESKPKMATAAQLAKRKFAAPKGRLNRSGSSTPTPSNPFSSSTFGAAQPQSQQTFGNVGGMTFGENKSFPPGISAPAGDFNFQPPSGSSSFTFGQPVQNNPFANLSSGTPQDTEKSSEDAMMESPQKKQTFGGFGASQNNSSAGGFSGFTGFGQSAQKPQDAPPQQQPSFSFGQSQTNGFGGTASTPLFGQTPTQEAPKAVEQESKENSVFGRQSTSSAPTTNGIFGQSAQQNTTFSFGQSTAEPPKSPFTFGQPQTQAPAAETPKAPTFSFGQPSQAKAQTEAPKFSFGQSTSQPTSSTPSASISSTLFGAPQNSPSTNLFAGFGSSKPDESSKTTTLETKTVEEPKDKLVTSPETAPSPAPANPFASLFGTKPSEPSPVEDPSQTPKAGISFSASSQPGTLFGAAKTGEAPIASPASSTDPKPLFGFKPAEQSQSSSLFSPDKNAKVPSFGSNSLFGKTDAADKQSSAQDTQDTPAKISNTFTFGQSTMSQQSLAATSKTTGFSFGEHAKNGTEPKSQAQVKPGTGSGSRDDAASATQPLFTPSKSASQPKPAPTPAIDATDTSKPSSSNSSVSDNAPEEAAPQSIRKVYSNPPPRIPPYLDAEQYKAYDSCYRLHSLNREFQKRIAVMNPTKEDFENIVRFYVAARESIGQSIGLYTRNIAGMKRKGETQETTQDDTQSAKKPRQSEPAATENTPVQKSSAAGSIFQPVASTPKPTPTELLANFGSSASSPAKPSDSSSSASTLFKSMIPEAKTSSSTTTTNPFANLPNSAAGTSATMSAAKPSFSFGSTNTVNAGFAPNTNTSTTPPSSPPKKSGFQMPTFSAPSGGDFMGAFAQQSAKNAAKFAQSEKEKRKAEEFDSDEDDEEAWNKKYEEEEQNKRAKIGSVTFQGFIPTFGTSASKIVDSSSSSKSPTKQPGETPQSPVDISSGDDTGDDNEEESPAGEDEDQEDEGGEDDEDEDAEGEDEDEDEENESSGGEATRSSGKSLFDRISRSADKEVESTPSSNAASALPKTSSLFGNAVSSTPEAPSFSPITPATGTPYKPASTFNFTSMPRDSPTPTAGASVFEGGLTKSGPIPGEGLFGSRSSTPVNGEKPKSALFGNLGTPQKPPGDDHTWKRGSGIKFDSTEEPPSVSITAPTPMKDTPKFGTLFGMGNTNGSSSTAGAPTFGFGSSTSGPAPGFLGAASHLAPGSGTNSGFSSRATSPGATDNESIATNETDDAQNEPQTSLMATSGSYPGEEDEDVLFEVRAKIMKNYKEAVEGTKKTKGWNTEGVGPMRVLKHKETGKARIVARAEPGAHVVLNTNLTAQITYKAAGNNIQLPVFEATGAVQWLVKVKTPKIAEELVKLLEENKGSA